MWNYAPLQIRPKSKKLVILSAANGFYFSIEVVSLQDIGSRMNNSVIGNQKLIWWEPRNLLVPRSLKWLISESYSFCCHLKMVSLMESGEDIIVYFRITYCMNTAFMQYRASPSPSRSFISLLGFIGLTQFMRIVILSVLTTSGEHRINFQ